MKLFGLGKKDAPLEKKASVFGFTPLGSGAKGGCWESSALVAAVDWAQLNIAELDLNQQKQVKGVWVDEELNGILTAFPAGTNATLKSRTAGTTADLMTRGNAIWVKLIDDRGKTVALQYIPWDKVQVKDDGARILSYTINNAEYTPSRVIHFRKGTDPIKPWLGFDIWNVLNLHAEGDAYAAAYYNAIVRSPAAKKYLFPLNDDDLVSDESCDKLTRTLTDLCSVNNAGGFVVSNIPLKEIDLSMNPNDLAIENISSFIEERICALLHIPPQVLNLTSGNNTTFNNYSHAKEAAVQNFLVPMWKLIAQTITEQAEFISPTQRVVFKYESLPEMQENKNDDIQNAERLYKSQVIDRYTAKEMSGIKPDKSDVGVYYTLPTKPMESTP